MTELKNIFTLQDLFKVLKNSWRGNELVSNFNRSILFELSKQNEFNKLIKDTSSTTEFIFKFKRKRFTQLAKFLINNIYNYVKNDKLISYNEGDDISALIKNVVNYIKTNATVIQMIYNLWKEEHKDNSIDTNKKTINSIYNANDKNDKLFEKGQFNYTNNGQVFLFINDEFILDEDIHVKYPTDNIFNQLLNNYTKQHSDDSVQSYAFGMQYPSGTCFIVKEQNMGISSYQKLKSQAEANKVYKILSKKLNTVQTQRMAKK